MAATYCCSGDARCVAGEEEEAAAGAEAVEELRVAVEAAGLLSSAVEAAVATVGATSRTLGCTFRINLLGLLMALRLDTGALGAWVELDRCGFDASGPKLLE